jgi:probable F420-dependent oxidoreductase
MQACYGLPFSKCPPHPAFVSGDALGVLGREAEQAGFNAVYLTEHPAPGDAWRQAGGHDALDPFVGLAFVAAATRTVKVMTNLTVLPYRNPFLTAKASASLDALSGGRLILGVGTGYLESEFKALGVDFDQRNTYFDEAIDVLKLAWTGEPVAYQGTHFTSRNATVQPPPVQRPIPIWIGGNSKLTLRRVAEHAQGWMPMPAAKERAQFVHSAPLESVEDVETKLEYLHEHAAKVGRSGPWDVVYPMPHLGSNGDFGAQVELARQLRDVGVTGLVVNGEGTDVPQAIAFVRRYSDEVLAKL